MYLSQAVSSEARCIWDKDIETGECLSTICICIQGTLISGTKSANVDSVEEVLHLNDHGRRTVLSWCPSNSCSTVVSVHNDCW